MAYFRSHFQFGIRLCAKIEASIAAIRAQIERRPDRWWVGRDCPTVVRKSRANCCGLTVPASCTIIAARDSLFPDPFPVGYRSSKNAPISFSHFIAFISFSFYFIFAYSIFIIQVPQVFRARSLPKSAESSFFSKDLRGMWVWAGWVGSQNPLLFARNAALVRFDFKAPPKTQKSTFSTVSQYARKIQFSPGPSLVGIQFFVPDVISECVLDPQDPQFQVFSD